jgi:hypothetical protein
MRLVRREKEQAIYQVYEEEASPQVIKLFLEKATGRVIHGVKNHFAFTRLFRNLDFEFHLTDDETTRSANACSSFHLQKATVSGD